MYRDNARAQTEVLPVKSKRKGFLCKLSFHKFHTAWPVNNYMSKLEKCKRCDSIYFSHNVEEPVRKEVKTISDLLWWLTPDEIEELKKL